MVKNLENIKIFGGDANPTLTSRICAQLGIPDGEIYLHTFPSGEKYCQLKENVRGKDVFIIQSIILPANDNLMQLLVIADACRRASVKSITAIIPYLGYSRQDRKDKSRVPISAKLVMDIIAAAGINRVVTMDLHAPQIAGFTNLPFDHLYFRPALIDALKNTPVDVVVAPDIGAVKRAEEYSKKMNVPLAFISKQRKNDTTVEVSQFVGNVAGEHVLIIDDLTESMGTMLQAAKICRENGAQKVYCAVTHYCLTEVGIQRLINAYDNKIIDKFYFSNTTDQERSDSNLYAYSKFESVIDVAPIFAKAINGIIHNESISEIFN